MKIFLIVVIVILIIVLIYFILKNMALNKKLDYYKMISSNISTMGVIQKMFEILGSNILASKKVEELNKVILETYTPRYSTISLFDGNGYEIKASNVENEYKECIVAVADDNDFKINASKNISKYLTTSVDKTLVYMSANERKIRSSLFTPIYFNNTYLGFWLMEDEGENAFDGISKDELNKIKNNLGVFVDTVQFQETIEIAESKDVQTGFFNNLFLYSNVRNVLSNYDSSVIVSICLSNIPDINANYGRSTGDKLLLETVDILKQMSTEEQFLVRYSGIKFLLISPNSNVESMQETVERILARLKTVSIATGDSEVRPEIKIIMHTYRKQNNIEKEIQKIISASNGMRDVNTMKVV